MFVYVITNSKGKILAVFSNLLSANKYTQFYIEPLAIQEIPFNPSYFVNSASDNILPLNNKNDFLS
jgi:hypothetical protein